MADKYHYDKNNNYIGKTSDTPPSSGCLPTIVFLFIVFAVINGLISSCNRSEDNASTSQEQPMVTEVQTPPVENVSPPPPSAEPGQNETTGAVVQPEMAPPQKQEDQYCNSQNECFGKGLCINSRCVNSSTDTPKIPEGSRTIGETCYGLRDCEGSLNCVGNFCTQ